jgi:hypothetical protein
MEADARERVFIYLRDRPHATTDEKLYEALTGRPRTRQPGAWDCYNLLRAMGIEADITYVRYPTGQRFESVEAAVDDCSLQLGTAWREEQGRAWIEANLIASDDGTVGIESGEMVSGVLHWAPTS